MKRFLKISQPTREVLEFVARSNAMQATGVELALDWCFDSEQERDRAYRIFITNSVKKYLRGRGVVFFKLTRYTSPRRGRNNLVNDPDKPSKASGEVGPRARRDAAERQSRAERKEITLASIRDIDPRAFWQKHLRMARVNARRLGTKHDNHVKGQNRRKPSLWTGGGPQAAKSSSMTETALGDIC